MQRYMVVRLEQEGGTTMPKRRACLYLLVNEFSFCGKLMYIILSVWEVTASVRAWFRHGFLNTLDFVSLFTQGV